MEELKKKIFNILLNHSHASRTIATEELYELFVSKSKNSAVWVKASEFKTSEPVYRPYRRKRNNDNEEPYDYGEIYVTEDNGDIFFDVNNERLFEPQTYECWKDYEILDESGTAVAPTGSHWLTGSYDKLYDQVKGGKRTVCYVDYKWPMHPRSDAMRDICTISSVTMEFVSRGHGYGSVRLMDGDEKTNFIELCKELNVEWLCEGTVEQPVVDNQDWSNFIPQMSNIQDRTGISIEWQKVWAEVENWYGDIKKKETGEQFLKRMQATYFTKTPAAVWEETEGVKAVVDALTTIYGTMIDPVMARQRSADMLNMANQALCKYDKERKGPAAGREEDAVLFGKWLKHLDNGTTHYNPFTKEETASIGFSPADCFADDTITVEELYLKFKQQKENNG